MTGPETGRGVEALLARLVDERAEVERLERLLTAARKRRQLLLVKATRAGMSTRELGAVAGLSSPGVSHSVRSWRALDGAS